MSALTFTKRLQAIGFDLNTVPDEFCDSITMELMNHPVIFNESCPERVDISTFNNVRHFKPSQEKIGFFTCPFTSTDVAFCAAKTDDALIAKIQAFVSAEEKKYEDTKKAETKVKYDLKQAMQVARILETKDLQTTEEKLKAKGIYRIFSPISPFIAHNIHGDLITHPVIVDEKWTIDLDELMEYWGKNPEKNYCNPYTGKIISSLKYDIDLKKDIDAMCEQPQDQWRYEYARKIGQSIQLMQRHACRHAGLFSHVIWPNTSLNQNRVEEEIISSRVNSLD